MTPFQQLFVRTFYGRLLSLARDSKGIEDAKKNYQSIACQDNPGRYQGKQTFGMTDWPDEPATLLTALVAEALARTCEHYVRLHEHMHAVDVAKSVELIKSDIIPNTLLPKIRPDYLIEDLCRALSSGTHTEKPARTSVSHFSLFGGFALLAITAATAFVCREYSGPGA